MCKIFKIYPRIIFQNIKLNILSFQRDQSVTKLPHENNLL